MRVEREDFESALFSLKSNIGTLEEHEVIAEMARLMALFNWGHTRLTLPLNYDHLGFYQSHSSDKRSVNVNYFNTLPLRFYLFEDGLFVQSSTKKYSEYVGAEVINIDGTSIEEALNKIQPYLAVENESATKLHSAIFMSVAELLHAAGIIQELGSLNVKIRTTEGEVKNITVRPITYAENVEWFDWYQLNKMEKPLWLTNTKSGIQSIVNAESFWNQQHQYY